MNQFACLAASCRRLLARLRTDRRGNVMMILGFSMIPMVFGVGFGIDYTRAMRLKTRMDAAADAAALAAVNAAAMQETDTTKLDAVARNMFNAQIRDLKGLVYTSSNANPKIEISNVGGVNTGRTVKVSYIAQSTNMFSGVLGSKTLPVVGSATATATRAPHINFYLLMDTSPSMLLPTTQEGINALRRATASEVVGKSKGCAFACHVSNPQGDGILIRDKFWDPDKGDSQRFFSPKENKYYSWNSAKDNSYIWLDNGGSYCVLSSITNKGTKVNCTDGRTFTYSNGQYADTYWLVRNYKNVYGIDVDIPLRIDEEQAAAQALIPFAATTAANNKVTYKLQLFSFDFTRQGGTHPVTTITSTMADVKTMVNNNYKVPDFYASQWNWFANGYPVSGWYIDDKATEAHNALVRMNSVMPAPGDGTTAANPQEVLFIITDGIVDETQNGKRWFRQWTDSVNQADCTAIKNRGIRIAILYTEYLPSALDGDDWSEKNVQPELPKVEPALKKCASQRADGAPLYYKVTTDESIPQALSALFALTVQSARLTK